MVALDICCAHPWQAGLGPHAAKSADVARASPIAATLLTRQLDVDICRLDHCDRGHAWLEIQIVDGLTGQERDKAMRAGLDLDLGRDAVLYDARDDAGKAVARGLLDGRLAPVAALGLGDRREGFAIDEALPARAAHRDEPAVLDPAAHPVDADAKHLRRRSKPITRHYARHPNIDQQRSPIH